MRKVYQRPRLRTRPPVRQDEIVEFVRTRITEGALKPGDRVPGRCELTRQYGVSNLTVQRAFDRLIAAGFVCVHPPHGTFVAPYPPHRHCYAIAIPEQPPAPGQPWNRFWQTLSGVARASCREDRTLSIYHGIDRHCADGEDYRNLIHDVAELRLAGIIFASPPFLVAGSPILEAPGIPRVAVMAPASGYRLPAVCMSPATVFLRRAFEHLQQRGRRRIAVLCHPSVRDDIMGPAREWLTTHGLVFNEPWMQAGHMDNPPWNTNLAWLLTQGRPEERPDGLVITDDNLVPQVCEGIVAAGRRPPEDLDIVAHCNYPVDVRPKLPVKLLGYDVRGILDHCIRLIDEQRAGLQPLPETFVTPLFEEEVPASR